MSFPALTPRLSSILVRDLSLARGGLASASERKSAEIIANRLSLEASKMSRMFYAVLAMTAVAFIVLICLLLINANKPAAFTAISSASGLTLGGLLWLAFRTAREANQAGVLLILVANLPSSDALKALEALLKASSTSAAPVSASKKEPGT